jgi:hypothetical protein
VSDSYFKSRLFLGILCLFVLAIALIAEWLDRRTETPIMRKRVNDASDRYLATRGSIWDAALESARRFFRPPV